MERERRCPRCRISPRMDPQWVCEDCGHRDDLDLDALLAAADLAERLEIEIGKLAEGHLEAQHRAAKEGSRLRARAERLEAALLAFGRHRDTCDSIYEINGKAMPCDCGFDAALSGGEGE